MLLFAAIVLSAQVNVATLEQVNKNVNHQIRPMTDWQHYGKDDVWRDSPLDNYGDCEDYALTKRSRLLALGVPMDAMSIAIVDSPLGMHAVLEVKVDLGDRAVTYVLDNLDKEALPLTSSFLKHKYRTVLNGNPPVTAAIQ